MHGYSPHRDDHDREMVECYITFNIIICGFDMFTFVYIRRLWLHPEILRQYTLCTCCFGAVVNLIT